MIQVVRADCFKWVLENVPKHSLKIVITDPPYGKIVNQDWDQSWTLDLQWQMTALIDHCLAPGGTAFVWGGIGKPGTPRVFFRWLSEIEDKHPGINVHDVITWSKRRAYGTSSRLLFTREECAMLVKGDKPGIFNVPLLEEKRGYAGFNPKYPAKSEFKRRTNVWTDVNELFKGKIHECEKPSKLSEIMLEMSSNPGDIVLDMFAGSGSVGVAANNTGRHALLIERSDCEMHV